ncbi:hypothetical protein RND81_05G152600 [Saponaria officinalis]|uniref:Aminotransferase-like plant mobile domain-containing protein n=1 Tax=Saponaria officinalis TaxID=3572 RepID=A0AAW1KYF9_SAPOF
MGRKSLANNPGRRGRSDRSIPVEVQPVSVGSVDNAEELQGLGVGAAEGNVRRKRQREKKPVDAYGSPHGLYKLIGEMTEEQKLSVKEVGFGGLLELKASNFYHIMLPFLLEAYDSNSNMFIVDESKCCAITPLDVYDIFMIPGEGGMKVDAMSLTKKNYPDMDKVDAMRTKFGVGPADDVPLEAIYAAMLKLKDGGDDFKRYFVLYAMSSFLAPTAHNQVDYRLVRVVDDVDNIKNLDWCCYVLDKLGSVVETYKRRNTKNVGGCMFVLQLVYFHRLVWRGRKEPADLPLLKH